jgi:hypothetical protein
VHHLVRALLIVAGLGLAWPEIVSSQALATFETEGSSPPARELSQTAVSVPDSVRLKVGYQHWKGAAIGGALGAVTGLVLSALPVGCSDCSSTDSEAVKATLAGAGLAGAFGFLVGAASPKYKWQARMADTSEARPQ